MTVLKKIGEIFGLRGWIKPTSEVEKQADMRPSEVEKQKASMRPSLDIVKVNDEQILSVAHHTEF